MTTSRDNKNDGEGRLTLTATDLTAKVRVLEQELSRLRSQVTRVCEKRIEYTLSTSMLNIPPTYLMGGIMVIPSTVNPGSVYTLPTPAATCAAFTRNNYEFDIRNDSDEKIIIMSEYPHATISGPNEICGRSGSRWFIWCDTNSYQVIRLN